MLETTMPHADQIERAVIGSMLLSRKAIEQATEIIDERVFYNPAHAMMFEAVRHLYLNGHPVDQLTVTEFLREQGRLEEVGGEPAIAARAAETRSTANVRYHCEILNDKAQKRQAILLAQTLQRKAESEDGDAIEIISSINRELEGILSTRSTSTYRPLGDILQGSLANIEQRAKSATGLTGVTTGLSRLNRYTSGWQNSDFILLAALPSCGKTTLGMNMAVAAARSGTASGIFSLEMSGEKIGERMIAEKSGLDVFGVAYKKPTPDDWQKLSESAAYQSELPIFIDETSGLNVVDLSMRAKRIKREQGIGLVVVDYLQLMSGNGEHSRKLEIDNISMGLKGLAKNLRVPVIAISQLTRSSAREGRRPELFDLRESGQLEQDADVVVFIWDPPQKQKEEMAEAQRVSTVGIPWDDLREVFIAKQRNGPLKGMLVRWRKELYRFEELSTVSE